MGKKRSNKKKRVMRRKHENEFLEKIEHFNSRLIPYALILLTIVIILELGLHIENETLHTIVVIVDYFVITVFVIDLIFIAKRCNTVMYFFKNYWLDILAVFPFVIAFRFLNEFYRLFYISKEFKIGQSLMHETLEIKKGIVVASRTGKLAEIGRIGIRSIRLISKGLEKFKKN